MQTVILIMAKINVQLQNKTSYQSYKFQVRPLDSDMMRVDHCKLFEHESYMNYISNNSQFSLSTTKQAILPVYKFRIKQLGSDKMPEDPLQTVWALILHELSFQI